MDRVAPDKLRAVPMGRRTFLARVGLLTGGVLAATALAAGLQGCTGTASTAAADVQPTQTAVTVDTNACVGCKRCVAVAPEAFRMDSRTNKAQIIEGAPADAVERGAGACPVRAIH